MKRSTVVAGAVLAAVAATVAEAGPVTSVEYRGPGYTVRLDTEQGWATLNDGVESPAVRLEWSVFSFGEARPMTVALLKGGEPLIIDPTGSGEAACAILVKGWAGKADGLDIRSVRIPGTPFPVVRVEDAWAVIRVPATHPTSDSACRVGDGEKGARQIAREHRVRVETESGDPIHVRIGTGAVTWSHGRTTAVDIQGVTSVDADVEVTAGDRTLTVELRPGGERRTGRCTLIEWLGTGTVVTATELGQARMVLPGSEEIVYPFTWYDVVDSVDTRWSILYRREGGAPCTVRMP